MSKVSKYFYMLFLLASGASLFEGCGVPGAVFDWGWPRAIWLWLSEDLITH
jgi:hypothetical protein